MDVTKQLVLVCLFLQAQVVLSQTDFTLIDATTTLNGAISPIEYCIVDCNDPSDLCWPCDRYSIPVTTGSGFGPSSFEQFAIDYFHGPCDHTVSDTRSTMGSVGSTVTASFWTSAIVPSHAGSTSSTNSSYIELAVPARGFVTIDVIVSEIEDFFCDATEHCPDFGDTSISGYAIAEITGTTDKGSSTQSSSTSGPSYHQLRKDLMAAGAVVSAVVDLESSIAGGTNNGCADGNGVEVDMRADVSVRFSFDAYTCLADVNGDEMLSAADFGAWVNAYSDGDLLADQNQNGVLDPGDFGQWIINYNDEIGC